MSEPLSQAAHVATEAFGNIVAGTPNTSQPTFTYDALRANGSDFRLLNLRAAAVATDPIEIELEHADWNNKPKYVALSYTWGRPTEQSPLDWDDDRITMPILVNGKLLKIRPNLFHALSALRPAFAGKAAFWIDAICINQDDLVEKATEIKRMRDIYHNAVSAVVWLGPADETTIPAYRKITQVSRSWNLRPPELKAVPLPVHEQRGDFYRIFCEAELGADGSARSWDCVRRLFNRNWWKRAWVLQEVCTSTQILVTVGPLAFVWTNLVDVQNAVRQHTTSWKAPSLPGAAELQKLILVVSASMADQMYTQQIKEHFQNIERTGERLFLEFILQKMRGADATDARDKVYAGLGLSEEGRSFEIDYHLAPQMIFTKLAAHRIESHGDLSILSYCKYPSLLPDLPSWTPDWTDRRCEQKSLLNTKLSNPSETTGSHPKMLFQAGGPSEKVKAVVDEQKRQIVLEGAVLDKIAFVASKPHRQLPQALLTKCNDAITDQLINEYLGAARELRTQDEAVIFQFTWLRQWAIHQQQTAHTYEKIDLDDWEYDPADDNEQFRELFYTPTNEHLYAAYFRTLCTNSLSDDKNETTILAPGPDDIPAQITNQVVFEMSFFGRMQHRVLAVTSAGYLALVPDEAVVGDATVLVTGNDVPLVLRPVKEGMAVIGECYIHGAMDGKLYEDLKEQGSLEDVVLV